MPTAKTIIIRPATREDAHTVISLVRALAGYEKLDPPDHAACSRLVEDYSGEHRRFDAFLAEVDGQAAGYAFVLETYSSFLALPTLYLEDLFVLPEARGLGVGYRLFREMVAEARRRGCGRMEWSVLDWNQIAIDFYQRMGATHKKEWQLYRLLQSDFDRILE